MENKTELITAWDTAYKIALKRYLETCNVSDMEKQPMKAKIVADLTVPIYKEMKKVLDIK